MLFSLRPIDLPMAFAASSHATALTASKSELAAARRIAAPPTWSAPIALPDFQGSPIPERSVPVAQAHETVPGDWLEFADDRDESRVGSASVASRPGLEVTRPAPWVPLPGNSGGPAIASQPMGFGAIEPFQAPRPRPALAGGTILSFAGETATSGTSVDGFVRSDPSGGGGGQSGGGTTTVHLEPFDGQAAETVPGDPLDWAYVTIAREVPGGTAQSPALIVNLTFGGCATYGVDYLANFPQAADGTITATIPQGESFVFLEVRPIDDSEWEGPESVIASLAGGTGYTASGGGIPLSIADNEHPEILAKRSQPTAIAEQLFPINQDEHFDLPSTFYYTLTPGISGSVSWQIFSKEGSGRTELAHGSGTAFSYKFSPEEVGRVSIEFKVNPSIPNMDCPGDQVESFTFVVKPVRVYNFNIEVSSKIAPLPLTAAFKDQVRSRLVGAQNLLLSKDAADDYRAAVEFRALTITGVTATGHQGNFPDPVNGAIDPDSHIIITGAEYNRLWDRASDLVFVDDLRNNDLPNMTRGITDPNSPGDMIVDWGSADDTIAHEIGHRINLPHAEDTEHLRIMHPHDVGRNLLTLPESEEYDK